MIRTHSGNLRNNHHSLCKKQVPYSLQNSQADTVSSTRKKSRLSIKENIPDFDKIMADIKISQNSQTYSKPISQITCALKNLKKNIEVEDEVKGIQMLMQTIQKKLTNNELITNRSKLSNSFQKRQVIPQSTIKLVEKSPIREFGQDSSSRILYTNFSIKDIERGMSPQSSIFQQMKSQIKNNIKEVSDFEESDKNLVQKLNSEIKELQLLLQKKTNCPTSFKKRQSKFK